MTRTATPLETLLARLLGDLGNLTLKLDPMSQARLEALDGVSVRFEVIGPLGGEPRPMTLTIAGSGLSWHAGAGERPNAIVTGTLPAIASLLGSAEGSTAGQARIEGDESVLREVAGLLRHLEPDLAEPMGGILGRDMADNLIGMAEAGIAFLKSAAESVAGSAREGARAAYVADPDFLEALDNLDDLQLRVDRLTSRIGLLEAERDPDRLS